MMLTEQQIFDKVVTHLFTQGRKAGFPPLLNGKLICRYRTPEGLSCAAGCLIKDEHYTPSLEGHTVNNSYVRLALTKSGVGGGGGGGVGPLLCALQHTHDELSESAWFNRLLEVGAAHCLDLTVINRYRDTKLTDSGGA